jgi:hypothetical protein
MRIFGRVFLIVLLVASTAYAADSKQPVSEHVFNQQVPADLNQSISNQRAPNPPSANAPRKFPSDNIELRTPCLTMRSYKFARQGADALQYRGVTTCTPASQFQVKRAPFVLR